MLQIITTMEKENFLRKLEAYTLKDCYEELRWSKGRSCYFSGSKGNRFYLYYRPAGGTAMFATFLRGKLIQNGKGMQLLCWYGKENVVWIRALLMAVPFGYAAYLLRSAAPVFALAFLLSGVASLALASVHLPKNKKRLLEKLMEILSDNSENKTNSKNIHITT